MDGKQALNAVRLAGETLSRNDAQALMAALLQGELGDEQIADLLTTLHERGETSNELAGFASAMQAVAEHLPLTEAERDSVVDTCGTGGDGSGSFNISTAVALVAAAAGVSVAKHGNRKITSRCGSADVLEALGIPVNHSAENATAALRQHGFAFLLASAMHPAMKRVGPVRRRLPFRTVFNLLGPMTSPARARRQVIGVYSAEAVHLVADALAARGDMLHAMVVHGSGGLDELSLEGVSTVAEVKGTEVNVRTLSPETAGLRASQGRLPGGDVAENAAILQGIFAGEHGPARDVVLLNAAAVFLVAGRCSSWNDGVQLAVETIDRGKVTGLLQQLQGGEAKAKSAYYPSAAN